MTKSESIQRLLNPGIVAVIRADSSEQLLNVCKALAKGGVTAMEITMTTPNAIEAIKETTQTLGDSIYMGVGSVLDAVTARLAILAGAEFVVTPVYKEEVIRLCNRYNKPIVCGSYTPTEALTAFENGADFIKVFPADGLGPSYIKALKAPMPQLEVIPTGGVNLDTCIDFLKAGCAGLAAGSSLVKKEFIQNEDWDALSDLASQYVKKITEYKQSKN